MKMLAFLALCSPLLGLIATTTLPDAIAPTNPDLALRLSPNHPKALLVKAEALRAKLLALSKSESADGSTQPKSGTDHNTERLTLRTEIRALAHRAAQHDPLNSRAFLLLAETSDDIAETRALMKAAVARSRRESVAAFWLLNDAFQRGDTEATLANAEILMRSRPELNAYVLGYLGQLGETDDQRKLLVAWLAEPRNQKLRRTILMALPSYVRDAQTPQKIMSELATAGLVPSADELKPYLGLLAQKGHIELAYYTWLKHLGSEGMKRAGNIYNSGFEEDASGLPFDWQIAPPRNATVEIRRREDGQGRALQLRFGAGRLDNLRLSQVMLISPGVYSFAWLYKGDISAKRGLRWQLTCFYPPHDRLLETEMMLGRQTEWSRMEARVTVPDRPNCRAQTLVLVHDARSSSEQLITGEAWFDDLKLSPAPPPPVQ
ncbi:MAG: hypothetical protein JNM89_11040 [Hyphomicrobiaceae bacterium]|nr:hypothetical protein [Hyphomicrobiaceae bacterium]